MTRAASRTRSGFTLIELMVVIVIIVILASLTFAVFRQNSTDKMRSAARIAQSVLLGAKDRALHAKELRGVRLIRDLTDPTLANSLVYLQPLPSQHYGPHAFQLERIDQNAPNNTPQTTGFAPAPDIVILRGFDGSSVLPAAGFPQPQSMVDWASKSQFFSQQSRIQIPDGGQWYQFTFDTSGPYTLAQGAEYLRLTTPFIGTLPAPQPAVVAFDCSYGNANCQISLGNDVLPFHQPIQLPSNCVIDLKFCSPNVQSLAGIGSGSNYFVDIMFSPRGGVSGYLSGLGPLHFLMRDLKDCVATSTYTMNDSTGNPVACGGLIVGADQRAGAANQWGPNDPNKNGDRMVLTVFPQTGLVQVFEIDATDVLNNVTGAAGPDGLADNIFAFAQQGKAAGR